MLSSLDLEGASSGPIPVLGLGVALAADLSRLGPTFDPAFLKDRRDLGVGDEVLPALLIPVEEHPNPVVLIGIAKDGRTLGPMLLCSDGGVGLEAPWIVTEPDGAVVQPETILGRWQRLVKAAKVPEIPLHGARHSYSTLALEAGVRLDVVSAQLGHSNVATTADIYAHVSEAAGMEAAEKVGSILARGATPDRGNAGGIERTRRASRPPGSLRFRW